MKEDKEKTKAISCKICFTKAIREMIWFCFELVISRPEANKEDVLSILDECRQKLKERIELEKKGW